MICYGYDVHIMQSNNLREMNSTNVCVTVTFRFPRRRWLQHVQYKILSGGERLAFASTFAVMSRTSPVIEFLFALIYLL
jgi:hypothetical protein